MFFPFLTIWHQSCLFNIKTATERAHWEWMQYALLRRIEEKVKVYSAQNLTQEELRSLVPSLQEEAA
jgi:hypothetical protein